MMEGYLTGLAAGVFLHVIIAYVRYRYDAYKEKRQCEKDEIYAAITRLENRIVKLEAK